MTSTKPLFVANAGYPGRSANKRVGGAKNITHTLYTAEMALRHGVHLPPFGELADPRVLSEVAAEAETAGFDGVFGWGVGLAG
ncbi:hypothetical protein BOX37_14890 [Nocardia mangyaensis]|uniref:Luciferase-like domain-containing protein n=1 Tax=Nocardia mangyaensis TaxID=2213200 RepID=A0A1J0VSW1_9NOCA|nr:hypothetical protein BOX37_14890 [Nocardia mangyaensis]